MNRLLRTAMCLVWLVLLAGLMPNATQAAEGDPLRAELRRSLAHLSDKWVPGSLEETADVIAEEIKTGGFSPSQEDIRAICDGLQDPRFSGLVVDYPMHPLRQKVRELGLAHCVVRYLVVGKKDEALRKEAVGQARTLLAEWGNDLAAVRPETRTEIEAVVARVAEELEQTSRNVLVSQFTQPASPSVVEQVRNLWQREKENVELGPGLDQQQRASNIRLVLLRPLSALLHATEGQNVPESAELRAASAELSKRQSEISEWERAQYEQNLRAK